MAKVSIVIPLYNKEAFIARALDSVFAQSFQDFEVIVVDDGSTDNGRDVVKSFNDPRLRLIRQMNAGPGAARNRGAAAAISRYVAFLDADDEYLPDFLAISLDNLDANPDCVLSVANHYRGPERIEATSVFPFNIGIDNGAWRLSAESDVREMWGSLIFLQTWAIVSRRELFQRFGGFYENHCSYAEDTYLWLQVLLNCRMYRDLRPLYWYHSEASELELWARRSSIPVFPFLADPETIRRSCPPIYRPALEKLFSYAASLNASYMTADEAVADFWRNCLVGLPGTRGLSLDHPRAGEAPGGTAQLRFVLDASLAAAVRAACAERRISLLVFFLSSLACLVLKRSGQKSAVIGATYADREEEEARSLFGCFIRTIPVRLDAEPELGAPQWLERSGLRYRSAWEHASITLDELLELAAVPRGGAMNQVCQAIIGVERLDSPGAGISGSDLAVFVGQGDPIELRIAFAAELFSPEAMDAFAKDLLRVARFLSGGSELSLGLAGILPDRAGAVEPRRGSAMRAAVPPVKGSRLGKDPEGNPAWFIPDPHREGRYIKLEEEDGGR